MGGNPNINVADVRSGYCCIWKSISIWSEPGKEHRFPILKKNCVLAVIRVLVTVIAILAVLNIFIVVAAIVDTVL